MNHISYIAIKYCKKYGLPTTYFWGGVETSTAECQYYSYI